MAEFLKTWGALIIALLALAQPWLRGLWYRFIWKPKIIPHPAGSIEVGFSGLGPTIGLIGTLECRRRQSFIRSIEIDLIRVKDKLERRFTWGIFRPLTFGATQQGVELSSGFLVRPEEPYRYNVQFWEEGFQKDLRPKLEALRQEWQGVALENFGDVLQAAAAGSESAPTQVEIRRDIERLYQKFSREDIHVNTFQTLQRMCYWEEGDYQIRMKVLTAHPAATHQYSWAFHLSDEDVRNLRLNIIRILQEVCGQPMGQFNFVYQQYRDDRR